MKYLLYGANGYTAQLIIKRSLELGLQPVLAGRNKDKIEKVANDYKLPFQVFSLENEQDIIKQLQGFEVCLNAAGPFSKTALPMVMACIAGKTHYLDITGEVSVFEDLKVMGAKALKAGLMLMPGAGFDVVPSDCLANYLKEKMPDAKALELAFTSIGGALSHGTATNMVESLGEGGMTRENDQLKKVQLAHKHKKIDFGRFTRNMATIPWGDISTAYTSTGIPNIDVYTSIPLNVVYLLKFQSFFNPILKTSMVRNWAQKWVDKNLYGPNEEANKKGRSFLYGKVSNGQKEQEAILECVEGYFLTALCSVAITKRILEKDFKPGYQTPAMAYGWQFILEMKGSEIRDI